MRPYQERAAKWMAAPHDAEGTANWVDMGLGKLQPNSEPVLTPSGWKPMGSLRPGDHVIGSHGLPTRVVAVFPQGVQEVVRLTFTDGSWCCVGWEHLWYVQNPVQKNRGRVGHVMTTRQLVASMLRRRMGTRHDAYWHIPMVEAVEFDGLGIPLELPVEPYLLGVILGDGTITESGAINVCTDREIIEACGLKLLRPHATSEVAAYASMPGIYTRIRDLGLCRKRSWEKDVPSQYMRASAAQRLALLQGLLDTDGSPIEGGGVEFSTTSEPLADAVVELAQSLGGIGKKAGPRVTTHQGGLGRPSWRVNVKLPSHLTPFRLQRKLAKWVRPTKYPVMRKMDSWEVVGREESTCIKVAAADSLYVTRHYIVTHNTISALTALLDLVNSMRACTALVVGPKKVVKNTWPEEIESWEHTRGGRLTYSVVVGTERQRLEALRRKADVYLVNAECLEWLERVLTHYGLLRVHGDRKRTPFDVVIIDEADLFKNRDSKRFKVMRRIARIANYVIELTGTPATEGYHHLWAQFYLLDGGKRLFPAVGTYLSTYFKNVGTSEQPKYLTKSTRAKERIHERIKDITFTLRAEDYLQLPKHNQLKRWVEMDEREWSIYRRMQRDALVRLADGGLIRAQSASAVNQKLAQLSNGQVYDDERRVHVVHRHKLEELQLIYHEAQGAPLLVVYEFQHDRDLIAREFGAVLFDDNKATEDRWNEGGIPMMLLHPKSGGHGVNIQFGGHNLVRYGLAHSLGLYLQVLKRLMRPGQPSPFINEWFIFTRGTLDEAVLADCIEPKNYTHEGLLNAMKRYVASQREVDTKLPRLL